MHDLVIRGGLVADGTGCAPTVADVAVDGDRIAAVGRGFGEARRTIDATGLLVAPGFIDIHTHSDFTLPVRPAAKAKLLQGVTTDCTGNCGFSPFPFTPGDGHGERHGAFFEPALATRWPSLLRYAEALRDSRPAINAAPLVGLGAVRLAVLGEAKRAASGGEIERMAGLVANALDDGAFGASSGLVYAPGGYADIQELVDLTRPVADRGRLYATHLRDEGDRLQEAVEEALATSRGSGCRLQISHHKAFGRPNWGKVKATLARVDEENAGGLDVAVDVYPYTAGCTTLAAALPPAALDGGEEGLRSRLTDPLARAEVCELVRHGEKAVETIILGAIPSRPELAGRRLVDVARDLGQDPAELLLDLVVVDGVDCTMVVDGIAELDVRTVLSHPTSMFGSDGWTMSADASSYVHPRDFGAAVRLLARYVRDEPVLDLGTAVRKLTALPAQRLRLRDRGILAASHMADITMLDLAQLDEVATFANPCRYPVGVRHLLVNGVVAVEDGVVTGVRSGRVLRAGEDG